MFSLKRSFSFPRDRLLSYIFAFLLFAIPSSNGDPFLHAEPNDFSMADMYISNIWVGVDSDIHDQLTDSVMDSNGDYIYLSGYTLGTDDVDEQDGFIMAYNQTGDLLWSSSYGGEYEDSIEAIAHDGKSSIFVAGIFGVSSQDGSGGKNSSAFAARYDAMNGSLVWEKVWGTESADTASGVAIDSSSDLLYVVGSTQGSFDVTAGAPNGTVNAGSADFFLTCLQGSNGDILWSRQVGSPEYDVAVRVAVGPSGGVFVVGQLGTDNLLESAKAFLGRWDDLGNQQFMVRINSTATHYAMDLTVGQQGVGEGTVYVTGHTSGGEKPVEIFLAEFEGDTGQQGWLSHFEGTLENSPTPAPSMPPFVSSAPTFAPTHIPTDNPSNLQRYRNIQIDEDGTTDVPTDQPTNTTTDVPTEITTEVPVLPPAETPTVPPTEPQPLVQTNFFAQQVAVHESTSADAKPQIILTGYSKTGGGSTPEISQGFILGADTEGNWLWYQPLPHSARASTLSIVVDSDSSAVACIGGSVAEADIIPGQYLYLNVGMLAPLIEETLPPTLAQSINTPTYGPTLVSSNISVPGNTVTYSTPAPFIQPDFYEDSSRLWSIIFVLILVTGGFFCIIRYTFKACRESEAKSNGRHPIRESNRPSSGDNRNPIRTRSVLDVMLNRGRRYRVLSGPQLDRESHIELAPSNDFIQHRGDFL